MKPIPVLTLTDYQLLRELTKSSQNSTSKKEIMQLSQELDRAIVNKNDELEDTIVRINSFVEIEDTKAKQRMKIQIVLPQLSNIKEGKVSVIAPLSIALIGFKENDEVDWEMPAGVKSLRIISVSHPVES